MREGRNFTRVGRLRSRERLWTLGTFPLVILSCLTAKSENIHGNCERVCKIKLIPRGFTPHKRARIHINFKSEGLKLKQKVGIINMQSLKPPNLYLSY